MGHIFYVMGKSASGKDTIYKILRERMPQIRTVVPYTTRPIREGEQDGVEYHFVDDKQLAELEKGLRIWRNRERSLKREPTRLFMDRGVMQRWTMGRSIWDRMIIS